MNFLAQLITWINYPVNIFSKHLLAPIGMLPGWLSNTIISSVTGVFLIVIFKYTSNQKAIGKIRDGIKADMLAMRLFKDNIGVVFSSHAKIGAGAAHLLLYSIRPMIIMSVFVLLLLAQMGVWYQARPLHPGEDTIVTLKFNNNIPSPPDVDIEEIKGAEIITGPVHISSKQQVLWKIRALAKGDYLIKFRIDHTRMNKNLTIGNNFMRLSSMRPGWHFFDILIHPIEKPFNKASKVQYISIDYPDRKSIFSGTNWWVIYFFMTSMVFAFIFKPIFKVKI